MRGLWIGQPYRSEALTRAARFIPCVRCGAPPQSEYDGSTVVMCHYFGPMRHRLGGGMGYKVSDAAVAALCQPCHLHLDSYSAGNTLERSEQFLLYIVLTYHAMLERGLLVPHESTALNRREHGQ